LYWIALKTKEEFNMSTHCGISVKVDGKYRTIYCHWDGYPKYMLPMLQENYNTYDLAAKLVSFGDASSIEARLEPSPDSTHSFDSPEKGVCVFYHRDRGQDWAETYPVDCSTRKDVAEQFYHAYIFENDRWNYYCSAIPKYPA
jgi:hypothetical protein